MVRSYEQWLAIFNGDACLAKWWFDYYWRFAKDEEEKSLESHASR